MNEIVYLFCSGTSLFWGAGLVAAAGILSGFIRLPLVRALVRMAAAVGVVLVVLSSVPLPVWVYPVWCGAVAAWLVREATSAAQHSSAVLRGAVVVSCLVIALAEGPRYIPPEIPVAPNGTVYVIGDSLSAGTGAGERVWPAVLDGMIPQKVVNLAQEGATTHAAWVQAAQIRSEPATVLVEIGGIDLLGDTPADEFEENLRALLGTAGGFGRQLVMFELPRPPLRNSYGRVQRELADEMDVVLLPRQILARAITTPGGTLDDLHLSDEGHRRLAEKVAGLIQVRADLFPPPPAEEGVPADPAPTAAPESPRGRAAGE
jgi:lysophospholipase L1-like esterase